MRLLVGLCLAVVLVGMIVTFGHNNSAASPPATVAVENKPYTPTSDDVAVRIAGKDVIASCGQPAKHWKTSKGKGQYQVNSEYLWYPKVPAEIMLVAYPNDPKEQMRPSMFYGGSPSITTNDMYDQEELARRMPCVAKWANIMAHALDDPK